jgi:hypothetical protein
VMDRLVFGAIAAGSVGAGALGAYVMMRERVLYLEKECEQLVEQASKDSTIGGREQARWIAWPSSRSWARRLTAGSWRSSSTGVWWGVSSPPRR